MKLNFVGDIMLGRGLSSLPFSSTGLISQIKKVMPPADHLIGNLESPILTEGRRFKSKDPHLTFKTAPQSIDFLKAIGLTVATLSNNHITDYGREGITSTIEYLSRAGIKYTGAGNNVEEAISPVIISDNNSRISILSLNGYVPFSRRASSHSAGSAWFDTDTTQAAIRLSDELSDGIIICVHWGIDYCQLPIPALINRAKRLIDKYPKVIGIIGHHPHLQQPVLYHKGRPIFCSLGNFIFDEPFVLSRIGSILTISIDGNRITNYTISFTYLDSDYLLSNIEGPMLAKEKERIQKASFRIDETDPEYLAMDRLWLKNLIYHSVRYMDLDTVEFLIEYYPPKKIINLLLRR